VQGIVWKGQITAVVIATMTRIDRAGGPAESFWLTVVVTGASGIGAAVTHLLHAGRGCSIGTDRQAINGRPIITTTPT
jgi:hypothetical protein